MASLFASPHGPTAEAVRPQSAEGRVANRLQQLEEWRNRNQQRRRHTLSNTHRRSSILQRLDPKYIAQQHQQQLLQQQQQESILPEVLVPNNNIESVVSPLTEYSPDPSTTSYSSSSIQSTPSLRRQRRRNLGFEAKENALNDNYTPLRSSRDKSKTQQSLSTTTPRPIHHTPNQTFHKRTPLGSLRSPLHTPVATTPRRTLSLSATRHSSPKPSSNSHPLFINSNHSYDADSELEWSDTKLSFQSPTTILPYHQPVNTTYDADSEQSTSLLYFSANDDEAPSLLATQENNEPFYSPCKSETGLGRVADTIVERYSHEDHSSSTVRFQTNNDSTIDMNKDTEPHLKEGTDSFEGHLIQVYQETVDDASTLSNRHRTTIEEECPYLESALKTFERYDPLDEIPSSPEATSPVYPHRVTRPLACQILARFRDSLDDESVHVRLAELSTEGDTMSTDSSSSFRLPPRRNGSLPPPPAPPTAASNDASPPNASFTVSQASLTMNSHNQGRAEVDWQDEPRRRRSSLLSPMTPRDRFSVAAEQEELQSSVESRGSRVSTANASTNLSVDGPSAESMDHRCSLWSNDSSSAELPSPMIARRRRRQMSLPPPTPPVDDKQANHASPNASTSNDECHVNFACIAESDDPMYDPSFDEENEKKNLTFVASDSESTLEIPEPLQVNGMAVLTTVDENTASFKPTMKEHWRLVLENRRLRDQLRTLRNSYEENVGPFRELFEEKRALATAHAQLRSDYQALSKKSKGAIQLSNQKIQFLTQKLKGALAENQQLKGNSKIAR